MSFIQILLFVDRAVLHLMRESIIPSYQCYQLAHGSPYLPLVNKLLRYLQEGGILNFWLKQSIQKAISEDLLVPYEDYEDVAYPVRLLDLKSLYPSFVLLLTGHLLGCIVFVFEVLYKRFSDYRHAKMHPFIN